MNRGIDRQAVFRSDDDRQIFYDCLAAAMPRYGVEVHAWCLLSNHFHLLLFSEIGRLSDAMRFLGGRFTQRINYRDGRDGPIFRGRFTSVAVKGDAHLVQASRYIHRNPVEAGLVAEPWQWPWSSAQAYLGLVRRPHGCTPRRSWRCSARTMHARGIVSFSARRPTRRCRRSTERLCHGVRPAGSDPMRARAKARFWHSFPVRRRCIGVR
jgi:REP element-mobilizing transposase RayT